MYGRVFVDDVHPVHEHDASLGVVEVRPAGRAQEARDIRDRSPAWTPRCWTGTARRAAQGHDVRRQGVARFGWLTTCCGAVRSSWSSIGGGRRRRRRRVSSGATAPASRGRRRGRPDVAVVAAPRPDRTEQGPARNDRCPGEGCPSWIGQPEPHRHPSASATTPAGPPTVSTIAGEPRNRAAPNRARRTRAGRPGNRLSFSRSEASGACHERRDRPTPEGRSCNWLWFSSSSSAHNICRVVCTRSEPLLGPDVLKGLPQGVMEDFAVRRRWSSALAPVGQQVGELLVPAVTGCVASRAGPPRRPPRTRLRAALPPEGRTGSVARVKAASRSRLDPVKSLEMVSTDTTLAPRSAKNWRKASSRSR